MNLKRTMLTAAILGATVTAGVSGAHFAGAQELNPLESLSKKIAQTFNLKQEEVDNVFDRHRDEMFEARLKQFEDRLEKSVTDRKITAQQKNLILEKKKEMHEKYQGEMRDLTPQQRREKKAERRAEWEKWASDNGIDPSLVMGGFGRGGYGRHGGCSAGTDTL